MKLVTFTANPAADVYMKVSELSPGNIAAAEHSYEAPGGKGINVSRLFSRFSCRSTALFTQGGLTGKLLQEMLRAEKVHFSSFSISGETRRNYIIENKKGERYKINSPGPYFSKDYSEKLACWILLHCQRNDVLYIGGSLPPGLDASFYTFIARLAFEKEVKCAFDVNKKYIVDIFNIPFLYLKANLSEIRGLAPQITSLDKAIESKKLFEGKEVIVSDGIHGASLFCSDFIYKATLKKTEPSLCTGCGDSLFAGYLMYRINGSSPLSSFKKGIAMSLATAFLPVYQLAAPSDMRNIEELFEIEKI